MAHAVSFPSRAPSERHGLAFWMKRTLEELGNLRSKQSADTVHDLRVSLRRCRSVAAVMEEIDPHLDWEEMRKAARKLFRALGELRDAHVMTDWVNQLQPESDSLKTKMLEALAFTEKAAQEKASRQAERFDAKAWKALSRSLTSRVRRVPLDGDAAHCLALERLEESRELHRRAMRTESEKPWHALRIGVKRFRYTAESLLPTVHGEWSDSLKRVQDVLGNIHDLDMLAEMLKKTRTEEDVHDDWNARIEDERHKNQDRYRQLALGTTSIWTSWLSGFPRQDWERYAEARIRATRSALDRKPARSRVVARLAMRIWSQLRAAKLGEVFSDVKERRVLHTAARLVGIRQPAEKGAREKSVRSFLLRSPVPPRWTFAEWERAAWAIRFQRGRQPTEKNKRFSRLTAEQQAKIILLAGILRLAFAVQKAGVTAGRSLRIEVLPQGVLLTVGGADDSSKNAGRFAEAKRLLELGLGKTILVQLEPDASLAKKQVEAALLPAPFIVTR